MAYIQQLPVDGTGAKIYPDAVMDAGTRGLIDMIDPWSWGGAVPIDGAALPLNAGPKNYPLAEDGWVEDAARAGTATLVYQDRGVMFSAAADRLALPVGFRHAATDRHLGYVLWLSNAAVPGTAAGGNNSIFGSLTQGQSGYTQNISINLTYSSGGAVTAGYFRTAFSAGVPIPATILTALLSGVLHQFGFELQLSADSTTVTYTFYLDGVMVSAATVATTGSLVPPGAADYACLGRHGGFPGSGLYGTAWRAICQQLDIAGARTMAETVALDYQLNAARIAAVV